MEERIKIALQKSGRLHDGSLDILKKAGIKISVREGVLKASSHSYPADVLLLRNSDIPEYVQDGVADLAIVGSNLLEEVKADVEVLMSLGFSKCKVSLAVPKDVDYKGNSWFNGKRIATSYPNTLQKYLDEHSITAELHVISGSVEIAPNIGLSDAVFDIVSSGSTLFKNGLREVETVLRSEAVLIGRKDMESGLKEYVEEICFRLRSVIEGQSTKYVLLNAPNDRIERITKLLPGVKSPTIMPLATEGWSSLHSVVPESDFWRVINDLKEAGAKGILVLPIEKMVQ